MSTLTKQTSLDASKAGAGLRFQFDGEYPKHIVTPLYDNGVLRLRLSFEDESIIEVDLTKFLEGGSTVDIYSNRDVSFNSVTLKWSMKKRTQN